MSTFKITEFPDNLRKQIVAIENDGRLIGTIYPTEEGIEVVPNHLMTCPEKTIRIGHNGDQNKPSILINLTW